MTPPRKSATADKAMTDRDPTDPVVVTGHAGKGSWYFVYITECPICGQFDQIRERRGGLRPESWYDRHVVIDNACASHFL